MLEYWSIMMMWGKRRIITKYSLINADEENVSSHRLKDNSLMRRSTGLWIVLVASIILNVVLLLSTTKPGQQFLEIVPGFKTELSKIMEFRYFSRDV